jgi:type I restriction enzyme S subunit
MTNAYIPISKLFNVQKGQLQSTKCIPGEFDFITAAEDWKTHESFEYDCEALIFAAAASGSLGRTHYVDGKFISSDLCYILTPKDEQRHPLNLAFYHFVFNSLRPAIVKATKSGTSKESINQSNFNKFELPYFDIEQQDLWISKLNDTLIRKDLMVAELDHQQSLLKKLRQRILQEAIEGKLTAEWRMKNTDIETASQLLERIAASTQLIKDKKIKSQKPLRPISKNEKPFEIPEKWVWCPLGEIADGFQYGTSSKSLDAGRIPVLRMGNIQNGEVRWDGLVFSNDEDEIEQYKLENGDLLFNRTNSRELVGKTALFRGNMQSIFAGYLIRFRMALDISPEYANFVMNSKLHTEWCNEVKTDALGQSNINATKLRMFMFPLPPLLEQNVIVAKVKKLLVLCDQLELTITANQTLSAQLMQSVLNEAFSQNESMPS